MLSYWSDVRRARVETTMPGWFPWPLGGPSDPGSPSGFSTDDIGDTAVHGQGDRAVDRPCAEGFPSERGRQCASDERPLPKDVQGVGVDTTHDQGLAAAHRQRWAAKEPSYKRRWYAGATGRRPGRSVPTTYLRGRAALKGHYRRSAIFTTEAGGSDGVDTPLPRAVQPVPFHTLTAMPVPSPTICV